MSEFKSTEIYKAPKIGPKCTQDTEYWKRLGFPIAVKDYGPIDYVDISPQDPYDFAVTCSAKIQIYSPHNNQVSRTISRFKKAAFGAVFRHDGNLLTCGTEEGVIALFDVQTKAQLRLFKGHKAPTHRCAFTNEGTQIISFSDDKTAAVWDIAGETKITSLTGHTDYIRAGTINPGNNSMVITGCYDHSVKLFDIRSSECVLSVDHGAPVEAVTVFPSGSLFVSAGGTLVKIWDAVNGRLLAQLSQHHKTITCLQFASKNRRLMSGSLDRQVKIYDTQTYQVVHTLQYPSPLLSLGISKEDKIVVAGMADGLLSIRHLKPITPAENVTKDKDQKRNLRYSMHGNYFKPADVIVKSDDQIKISDYDRFMKAFQISRALDSVLKKSLRHKKPEIAVSVMQELIRRGALQSALGGRDAKSLLPVTKFVSRHLPDPRFTRTLLDVAFLLTDTYGPSLGECHETCKQFEQLKLVMDKELKYIMDMMDMNGILGCLLSVANSRRISSKIDEDL